MTKPWIHLLLVLALMVAIPVTERALAARSRARGGPVESAGSRFLYGFLLGGMRAPVAGVHWLKVDLAFRKGRYFLIEKDLRRLAGLNPLSTQVWDYGAWHLAYNVSKRAAGPRAKCAYILRGLDFARQGLRVLPDDRTLLHTIGRICLAKGMQHRELFLAAEGRHPEAVAYAALDRLLESSNALMWDLPAMAWAARSWGTRLFILGRTPEAQVVLERGVQTLEQLRVAAGALGLDDETLRDLTHDRPSAEKWVETAGLEAKAARLRDADKLSEARRLIEKARAALRSIRGDAQAREDAEDWVAEAAEALRALDDRWK